MLRADEFWVVKCCFPVSSESCISRSSEFGLPPQHFLYICTIYLAFVAITRIMEEAMRPKMVAKEQRSATDISRTKAMNYLPTRSRAAEIARFTMSGPLVAACMSA